VLLTGSTPWEVDEAMVGFGFAMGPFESEDIVGLDVTRLPDEGASPGRSVPLARRMLELGKLGRKSGAGWYRYPGGGGKVEDPIVADLALEEARFAGLDRDDYDAGQIVERIVLAMIAAAGTLLDDGTTRDAERIDAVSVGGTGFPSARGGLVGHADALGIDHVVARLDTLAAEDAALWSAGSALRECAARGVPLARWRG